MKTKSRRWRTLPIRPRPQSMSCWAAAKNTAAPLLTAFSIRSTRMSIRSPRSIGTRCGFSALPSSTWSGSWSRFSQNGKRQGSKFSGQFFNFLKIFFSLLYLYNHVSIFENIFIFEPCEKENNVAERFGAKENREKMWQNFAASCQDLTDFQMIQERIKIIHCNLFFVNPNLNMHRKHADFRLLRN